MITAELLHKALERENGEKHPAQSAYFGPEGGDMTDYLYDGRLNLVRLAEILNEEST